MTVLHMQAAECEAAVIVQIEGITRMMKKMAEK